MNTKTFYVILLLIFSLACSGKYSRVEDEQFLGFWKLEGRSMFNGMTIEISRSDDGELIGHLKELNDNKYVQMFANSGDLWISDISRSSNFQFKITEKKIARELFGLYGLSSSTEFKAEFIDQNTIGLTTSGDPSKSSVRYVRVGKTQANKR